MKFGFISGPGATDSISLCNLCNKKGFYLGFWDVIWLALRDTSVQVCLVKFVQSMSRNAQSRVRANGSL